MRKLIKSEADAFFILLVISLIGNACADYALMWHGLSLISKNGNATNTNFSLSVFYIGQSIGVIGIAPIFSVLFDRLPKILSSVLLDISYAVALALMTLLFHLNCLSTEMIFLFSMLTASLAIIHKSSVGFGAIQTLSKTSGLDDLMPKFIAALNIPFLVGSVLSGIIFQYFGFEGCVIIGILSFLPMPFIYMRVFRDDTSSAPKKSVEKKSFIDEFIQGVSVLIKDNVLYGSALSVGLLNIGSAVLPGVVGFVFLKNFAGRTDIASIAISVSILTGVLLTKWAGRISKTWSTRMIIPISVVIPSTLLLLNLIIENVYLVAFAFMASCVGSAFRSISTGSLRAARVPKELIGRVNTVYSSILYLGQSLGGFFVVYLLNINLSYAILSIVGSFIFSALVSILILPKTKLSTEQERQF